MSKTKYTLTKSKPIYDWDREVPLKVKNANPLKYGYPSPSAIPGNEKELVVPCAPYDDSDGDRRFYPCESKKQANELLALYVDDLHKQDIDSRCVFYKLKADGTIIGVKCRKKCSLNCPKKLDPNNPNAPTPDYERTGNPISLDYKFDEDDPEENEHDVADPNDESPVEYCARKEVEARVQAFINNQDNLDQAIINLLLEDSQLSERDIAKELNVSNSTIHKRKVRLQGMLSDEYQKNKNNFKKR